MKLSRRQLKKLIEASIQLSQEEIDAGKKKLSDEGGAAGEEMVAKAIKDTLEGDPDIEDNDIVDAFIAADNNIVRHKDKDIIDTSGIEKD
jgi:hypothetical protein